MSNEANYKSELTAVFGHPVAENPTCVMQEAAFNALGLNWKYLTIEVLPEDLEDALKGMKAFNMKGVNLTIPHKVEVLKYLDEIAPDARLIGAVNTIRNENGKLIGENTDGKGFLVSLRKDAGVEPSGKTAVVLGAGGAARAITVELALAGVSHITLINRTLKRGQDLVKHLKQNTAVEAEFLPWTSGIAIPEKTDILVNATSIGLYPDIDAKPDIHYESIHGKMIVCDVIPNPPRTPFLNEAEKRGARTLDGLGMLVYQGAIGFRMWTGKEAPTDVMKKALEDVFG